MVNLTYMIDVTLVFTLKMHYTVSQTAFNIETMHEKEPNMHVLVTHDWCYCSLLSLYDPKIIQYDCSD